MIKMFDTMPYKKHCRQLIVPFVLNDVIYRMPIGAVSLQQLYLCFYTIKAQFGGKLSGMDTSHAPKVFVFYQLSSCIFNRNLYVQSQITLIGCDCDLHFHDLLTHS